MASPLMPWRATISALHFACPFWLKSLYCYPLRKKSLYSFAGTLSDRTGLSEEGATLAVGAKLSRSGRCGSPPSSALLPSAPAPVRQPNRTRSSRVRIPVPCRKPCDFCTQTSYPSTRLSKVRSAQAAFGLFKAADLEKTLMLISVSVKPTHFTKGLESPGEGHYPSLLGELRMHSSPILPLRFFPALQFARLPLGIRSFSIPIFLPSHVLSDLFSSFPTNLSHGTVSNNRVQVSSICSRTRVEPNTFEYYGWLTRTS